MPVLAALSLLLLGAAKLLGMGDASWQPLTPGAARGPETAAVHAATGLSQTLLRLPKDTVLPAGRHEVEATLVLLEGELTVEAEGKTFAMVQGSLLELPAGTSYRGRTKWDKKALVLITLAGPWSRAAE